MMVPEMEPKPVPATKNVNSPTPPAEMESSKHVSTKNVNLLSCPRTLSSVVPRVVAIPTSSLPHLQNLSLPLPSHPTPTIPVQEPNVQTVVQTSAPSSSPLVLLPSLFPVSSAIPSMPPAHLSSPRTSLLSNTPPPNPLLF